MDELRVIEIKKSVFADNDHDAEFLRDELKQKGSFLLNLMSAPGRGKTTTLIQTVNQLEGGLHIAVMEADINSDVDARKKKEATGAAPLMRQLPMLEKMLWGGTVMLVVDHIINGEVTWRYPFFTALNEVGGAVVMLREMLTVGLPMSLVLTALWAVYAILKERNTLTTTNNNI